MLVALLIGLLIGFLLAIPPGPVAVTAIHLGLDKGLKKGVLFSIGTGFIDLFYCATAIFATTAIVSLAGSFANDYPLLILIFQIIVITSIILFGLFNLKTTKKIDLNKEVSIENEKSYLYKLSHKGPFFLGVAVALTNIANPTFMATLAYITVNIHKLVYFETNSLTNFIFSLGFGFGNFIWLYIVIRTLIHHRERMSQKAVSRIYQFAGYTLIGFGAMLGYRVLILTKWSEILRLAFAF